MLDFFPYPTFREGQDKLLDLLERRWDEWDVIVLRLPVAFGKSPIAATIQEWELSRGNPTAIITPTNLLRDQYLGEFDQLRTVKSLDDYWLPDYQMTERQFRKQGKKYRFGPKGSQYNKDAKHVKTKGCRYVGNFYGYVAHKLQRHTLIVDEAHSLLATMQDFAAKRYWHHDWNYPDAVSHQEILNWLDTMPKDDADLRTLRDAIRTGSARLKFDYEEFRGHPRKCLKLLPISVANSFTPFITPNVKKVVLMSATISEQDLAFMGLGDRKSVIIDLRSPIPAENRPIYYEPVGDMSYRFQDAHLQSVAQRILNLADEHPGQKGFVHATYGLAAKLRPYLQHDPRMVFHSNDPKDKDARYKNFYSAPANSGLVMVGSGMLEGLDLKYEVANWQALTKVPYPSLMDPVNRYLANNHRDYYLWMVSRDILQASGRICRAPDDFGTTYLLDSGFQRWYNDTKNSLPKWFGEAVRGFKEEDHAFIRL